MGSVTRREALIAAAAAAAVPLAPLQGPSGAAGRHELWVRPGTSGFGFFVDSTATCLDDETLVGGGYEVGNTTASVTRAQIVMIGRPTWIVSAFDGSAQTSLTAYAHCLKMLPPLL